MLDRGKAQFERPVTAPATLLLVAPKAPPYGGMALQAQLLEKLLREDGHSVLFFPSNFPLPTGLRILDRIPGLRTLTRHVLIWLKLWRQSSGVEVIHVLAASWLYFFAVVAPAVIVGRARGKRIVLNYRGGDAERFFRAWGWAVKPLVRKADVVTAPSAFLAGLIHRFFGVQVSIVSNILDCSVFNYRERTAIRPRLIVARHLEKIYDIESVLKAFRVIQGRHPDACLAIVGTGSQAGHLCSIAADWNLRNVSFFGHVEHDDLPEVYDQYDIFLNASRIDNFPGALLEASAAGLVLVSTAAGGIPFMYQDGRDALLVEPGDWQGLADAVESVLQSPARARLLTTAGINLVRTCEWTKVRQDVYRTYGISLGNRLRA